MNGANQVQHCALSGGIRIEAKAAMDTANRARICAMASATPGRDGRIG